MNQEFLKLRLENLRQMLAAEISPENRRAVEALRAQVEEELRILEKSEPESSGKPKRNDASSK